jgi:hypothetical protein
MLFYITVGAPQALPGTACVEANRTACTEVYCSSDHRWQEIPEAPAMDPWRRGLGYPPSSLGKPQSAP